MKQRNIGSEDDQLLMKPEEEILVLVDDQDNEMGTDTRENCHLGKGRRHRAYVVFLFHGGKLLLQQRSAMKKLWPGAWDVSFTSHVYPGESYSAAAVRKGIQELDARVEDLSDVYSFVYSAPQGKYSENEFCRVLVGDFDGNVRPNPDEIEDIRWVAVRELEKVLKADPDSYTPWLKLAFEGFLRNPVSKRFGA